MDTGLGNFVPISPKVARTIINNNIELNRVFEIGELIKIKGSVFKVDRIKTRSLRLLLLSDEEAEKVLNS